MKRYLPLVLLWLFALTACGGHDCFFTSIAVIPPTAVADHSAAPPANSQQFVWIGDVRPGCVSLAAVTTPQVILRDVVWSVSDSTKVSISNEAATYGLATCLAATATPVTVTATLPGAKNHGRALTATAMLTCN
jgi:hypothetical protein